MPRECTCDPSGTGGYCPRCAYALSREVGGSTQVPFPLTRMIADVSGEKRRIAGSGKKEGLLAAARGQKQAPVDRYRSGTERRYAALLDQWMREEEIARWWYEPMKLWLAPRTTITIDFLLRRYDGTLELHEVKSQWFREDGWVKLKIAAAMYPCYRVILAEWKDGAWRWQGVPAQ